MASINDEFVTVVDATALEQWAIERDLRHAELMAVRVGAGHNAIGGMLENTDPLDLTEYHLSELERLGDAMQKAILRAPQAPQAAPDLSL